MAGVSTSDKSLFQARRVIVQRPEDEHSGKKKFHPEKLLPLKNFPNKRQGIITVFVLMMVIVGGAYGYYQYQLSQNPAVIYARKLKSMTDIVGQQVKLPNNEQPVVATVTDVTKLPKEAFFKNAQDGDKILLYKKDKEAILYRPATGKVITYATLDFENQTSTSAAEVAGASTSAAQTTSASATIIGVTPGPTAPFVPQGKILIQPQQ